MSEICTTHKAFGPRDLDEVLSSSGLRRTELRVALLDIFARRQKPQSQAELLQALEKRGLGGVDRVSIYRNLNQFVAAGLIHAVTANSYVTCQHRDEGGPRPHVVFYCPNCERHEEVCDQSSDRALEKMLDAGHFFAAGTSVLVSGRCRKCGGSKS